MPTVIDVEDATLAVVISKLDGVTDQIRELSTKMEDRPTWQDVRDIEKNWDKAMAAHVLHSDTVSAALAANIARLESWQTWAGRITLGSVATAVISAVFVLSP